MTGVCGRFVQVVDDGQVKAVLRAEWEEGGPLDARFNIAPTQKIWAVLEQTDRGRGMKAVGWGLVPSWSKDGRPAFNMINARSESVTTKPSYRAAASKRRCLVPASGYYEWMPVAGSRTKQPIYLHPASDELVAFAGLYEMWWPRDEPDAGPVWTATIITASAPDALGHIHDRTPVILPEEMWADWLSPTIIDKADVVGMLAAAPEPGLVPRTVGRAVGNVRNQGPSLIAEVA